LDSISERVRGGAGNRADEMQAKGRVARAETTLVTYTGELRTAEAQYIRTVGTAPTSLDAPQYLPDYIPGKADQILDLSLKNNPKIAVYKAEIDVAEQTKGQLESTMYPTVDAYLSTRHTDNLDGVDTYVQDNKAMLRAQWNIFNGTSDYYDIKTAAARICEAQDNLQDTTDDIVRQVASTLADYQSSLSQIEKYQEALQYSLESLDMYLMQFNVGQRSLLDLLDATNEVFTNRVQLETAIMNRDFTVYKFLALEGQLMKTLEIAPGTYENASMETAAK
ncbi:MAG TPA: TolC family protein, partial [Pseudodesulfovibrio sp.]|nr:TolC family protein [Pseudodesulfovibrio sp.]